MGFPSIPAVQAGMEEHASEKAKVLPPATPMSRLSSPALALPPGPGGTNSFHRHSCTNPFSNLQIKLWFFAFKHSIYLF